MAKKTVFRLIGATAAVAGVLLYARHRLRALKGVWSARRTRPVHITLLKAFTFGAVLACISVASHLLATYLISGLKSAALYCFNELTQRGDQQSVFDELSDDLSQFRQDGHWAVLAFAALVPPALCIVALAYLAHVIGLLIIRLK